jgi:NADP-dependent 3-hydroxy acid dehydrogenase YdfG
MAGALDGKVALVTGASSGIGEATAEALAEQGAAVVLAARRTDRLEKLHARLTERGVEALSVALDVTDEQAVRAAVDRAVEHFGGLDIVINNAGVMLLGKIVGADTTDWTRMVHTNLLGSMFVAHSALPHLLDRKGVLVQISSVAGRVARAGSGGYNATKWGINAFAEALRQEVTDRGVRVVVIEPGAVDTELREHITDQEARAGVEKRFAGIRQLLAVDIANAVVYAVTQPEHVAINEILVRPTDQVG